MSCYIGQKAVCVNEVGWRGLKTGRMYDGPRNGDVVTVDGPGLNPGYIALKEWRHTTSGNSWNEQYFRPVVEDLTASLARTESERIVEERPEHVHKPQTA